MQNTMNGIGSMITGVAVLIAVFMTLGRVDTYLKIKAMNDCAMISRYEATNSDGSKVLYPVKEDYDKCLSEKGYGAK